MHTYVHTYRRPSPIPTGGRGETPPFPQGGRGTMTMPGGVAGLCPIYIYLKNRLFNCLWCWLAACQHVLTAYPVCVHSVVFRDVEAAKKAVSDDKLLILRHVAQYWSWDVNFPQWYEDLMPAALWMQLLAHFEECICIKSTRTNSHNLFHQSNQLPCAWV